MDWKTLPGPPYLFRLKEVRARWRTLRRQMRLLELATRRLHRAQAEWPDNALKHAERILAVFRALDLHYPDEAQPRDEKRRDWYDKVGPRDH